MGLFTQKTPEEKKALEEERYAATLKKVKKIYEDALNYDEEIIDFLRGRLDTEIFYIVLTKERILLVMGTVLRKFNLDEDITIKIDNHNRMIVGGDAEATMYFDHVAIKDAKEFSKKIKEAQHEYLNKSEITSPLDQIKEFKELLDLGIFTQEEFDAKKKELFN